MRSTHGVRSRALDDLQRCIRIPGAPSFDFVQKYIDRTEFLVKRPNNQYSQNMGIRYVCTLDSEIGASM